MATIKMKCPFCSKKIELTPTTTECPLCHHPFDVGGVARAFQRTESLRKPSSTAQAVSNASDKLVKGGESLNQSGNKMIGCGCSIVVLFILGIIIAAMM